MSCTRDYNESDGLLTCGATLHDGGDVPTAGTHARDAISCLCHDHCRGVRRSMSEEKPEQSVLRADKLSRYIAMFYAMGLFGLAVLLIGDPHVSAAIAAFSAIGVRIYLPYHVSVWGERGSDRTSQSYEMTGNYHHGALGLALFVASFASLAVYVYEETVYGALAVGLVVGAVLYVALRAKLPS